MLCFPSTALPLEELIRHENLLLFTIVCVTLEYPASMIRRTMPNSLYQFLVARPVDKKTVPRMANTHDPSMQFLIVE